MPRYEFEQAKTLETILTFSSLENEERALVDAVTKWSDPNRFAELIRQVHGRSIEFQSPSLPKYSPEDYFASRYNGLQIYGAGGLINMPTSGLFAAPPTITISPVDAYNHAEQLSEIIQLQQIDDQGQLQLWNRSYAPLRGMDEGEAERRKRITTLFAKALAIFQSNGHESWIRVPTLAAEGIFPSMMDPDGKPLRFQVYRVPLVERFPTQFIRSKNGDEIYGTCGSFSYLMGRTLRLLHRNMFAYMDGHVGNMSLLSDGNKEKLFITDLGSLHDFSEDAFPDRYRGIDFIMFFETMEKLLLMYRDFLRTHTLAGTLSDEIVESLRVLSRTEMMGGYFETELANQKGSDQTLRAKYAYFAFLAYKELGCQQFLEFMENFLQATCNSERVGFKVEVDGF